MDTVTTTRRLVHDRWRPLAQSAITAGIGVALLLGVLTFHDGWTSYDAWVLHRFQAHIGPWAASQLVGFTEPAISVALIAFVAIGAAVVRRLDLALFAVTAPVIAVVLASEVLKPLIDRPGPLLDQGPAAHRDRRVVPQRPPDRRHQHGDRAVPRRLPAAAAAARPGSSPARCSLVWVVRRVRRR